MFLFKRKNKTGDCWLLPAAGGGVCLLVASYVFASSLALVATGLPAENESQSPPADAPGEQLPEAKPQLRDPFWPVGFVPGGRAPITDKSFTEKDKTPAQVSGESGLFRIGPVVKKGGKFYATINGVVVQAGDVITAVSDGEVYRFAVETIDFKKIKIKPVKR